MNTVRLCYPFVTLDRRLCTIHSDVAALCQLLNMVRDLAPGDFPGMSQLHNPCDKIEIVDPGELLPELQARLQAFVDSLPGVQVRVGIEVAGVGPLIGFVLFNGADWRVRVPVLQSEFRVILDLDRCEEV